MDKDGQAANLANDAGKTLIFTCKYTENNEHFVTCKTRFGPRESLIPLISQSGHRFVFLLTDWRLYSINYIQNVHFISLQHLNLQI